MVFFCALLWLAISLRSAAEEGRALALISLAMAPTGQ